MTTYITYDVYNGTNISSMFIYANTVTGGLFSPFILFITFIVGFFVMRLQYGTELAFASSSFVTLLLSIFLIVGAQMSPLWAFIPLVATIGGMAIVPKRRE